MDNYHLEFQYLHEDDYATHQFRDYSPQELISMFNQEDNPQLAEIAYLNFISKSPLGLDFDFERRVLRTNMQLRLPLYKGQGISWKLQWVNPDRIWASEDTLDHEKYELIKTATKYANISQKPCIPPIIWHIPQESRYKYVCHDGHHRVRVFSDLQQQMVAIMLEYWIDNYENPILPQKLHYRTFNCLVKDMPIIKRDFPSF